MNLLRSYFPVFMLAALASCSQRTTMSQTASTAPVIIYQTKADYSQYIPVRLSEDGSRIVAYPAPSDVRQRDSYRYPIKLAKGYYWDQQGVSPNTAFLSITYAEYAALETAPAPETLLANILERTPFLAMYHAGNVSDYRKIESELNEIITQKRLSQLTPLLPEKDN